MLLLVSTVIQMSCFSFQPFLNRQFGIHDTCGVHNLHGLPGIVAAIVGAITAACATEEEYNYRWILIWMIANAMMFESANLTNRIGCDVDAVCTVNSRRELHLQARQNLKKSTPTFPESIQVVVDQLRYKVVTKLQPWPWL